MKILHIEDNTDTAKSFQKLLYVYKPNWKVVHVLSVLKAFERLNTEKFDIVVIDFHLDKIYKGCCLKDVLNKRKIPYTYYSAEREKVIRKKDKTGRYISKVTTDIELIPVLLENFYYEAKNANI